MLVIMSFADSAEKLPLHKTNVRWRQHRKIATVQNNRPYAVRVFVFKASWIQHTQFFLYKAHNLARTVPVFVMVFPGYRTRIAINSKEGPEAIPSW